MWNHTQKLLGHRLFWAWPHRPHPKHRAQQKKQYMIVYGGMYDHLTGHSTSAVRHHVLPRTSMCVASERVCLTPLRVLAVMRFTFTDLYTKSGMITSDTWVPEAPSQKTRERCWVNGRELRSFAFFAQSRMRVTRGILTLVVETRETTRPEVIAPEIWRVLPKAQMGLRVWLRGRNLATAGPPRKPTYAVTTYRKKARQRGNETRHKHDTKYVFYRPLQPWALCRKTT